MVTLRMSKCVFIGLLSGLLFITKSCAMQIVNNSEVSEASDGMQAVPRLNLGVFKMAQSTKFFSSLSLNDTNEQTDRKNINFGYNAFNRTFQFVVLFFIGIALELDKLKCALHPIGIGITFLCNWILAPILCEWIGSIVFTDKVLQFLIFQESIRLMGILANTWTVVLGGNIHLSLVLSIVNSIAACGMQPLWLLTRGKRILDTDVDISFDYFDLIWNISYLIVPCVGFFIQPLIPTYKKHFACILTLVSWIYIIFYTALIISLDVHVFHSLLHLDITLKFVLIGLDLAFAGYLAGWFMSLVFKQEYENRVAIATESTIFSLAGILTSMPMIVQLIWNKAAVELDKVQRNRERMVNSDDQT